jgi:predicted lipoprotein with Yx(FWY)xxD motif
MAGAVQSGTIAHCRRDATGAAPFTNLEETEMRTSYWTVALLALATTLAVGCASLRAQGAPADYYDGVLVDYSKKMTLYTFDKDPDGRSVCNGPCAANWPPFMANADEKDVAGFTKVKRDDGKLQWAYKGKPLYFWVKDQKPGDKTGDGFNNVWRIVK